MNRWRTPEKVVNGRGWGRVTVVPQNLIRAKSLVVASQTLIRARFPDRPIDPHARLLMSGVGTGWPVVQTHIVDFWQKSGRKFPFKLYSFELAGAKGKGANGTARATKQPA